MAWSNGTAPNTTMKEDLELDNLCRDPSNKNSTICNKSALGINLSTPILMMSFGVLGNILALVVLYTSRKEIRKTVFFTLLAGLAWTDVIGQMCTAPIAIVTYAHNLQWQGGALLCSYHGFVMVLFGILHPLIVFAMSLERLFSLKFTYLYARTASRRKAQYVIVGCWVFTVFFCTWPLMGFGSFELQFPGSWCFLNFHRESTTDMIYAYLFAILNILVITFIFVCNSFVVITLLKMRRSRKLNNSPSLDKRLHVKPKALKLEMETEMVWFLGAVTIVFCVLWMPLNINIVINQISGQMDVTKDLMGVRLASINQILDPWLYILLRKAMFFKVLKRIKLYISEQKTPNHSISQSHRKTMHSQQDSNAVMYHLQSICAQDCSVGTPKNDHSSLPSRTCNVAVSQSSDLHTCVGDVNSDSETDVFLEAEGSSPLNFVVCSDDVPKADSRRKSHEVSDKRRNPIIHRMNSLPAYLTGRDNHVMDI